MNIETLIQKIPKAELHLHIEGTLEPELMMKLAKRNGVQIPYSSVHDIRTAYQFSDLQSFLDIYYAGAAVLLQERDFHDLTWAYLERAKADNVRHVEIFFDPQTHTERGIDFNTVINGIYSALLEGQKVLGISSGIIMCFLRHLSAAEAMSTLNLALPHKDKLLGVGLDSSELGHPPEKFTEVFDRARAEGLHTVAHAGEEGPPEYIWQALDLLKAKRIDHGVRAIEDPDLLARLAQEQIPLTVCPLSNVKLRVFESLSEHNLKLLMNAGLCITLNSDDPAYFGGYLAENFLQCHSALSLGAADIFTLAKNSFVASFMPEQEKTRHITEINSYLATDQ